ncbi:hypothetical protein Chor_002090 [Crotalus horridus]
MDATKRPLYIPPQMGLYAEKHRLFDMMQDLLGNLLIHRPENPLDFLIRQLKFSNCDDLWAQLIEERMKLDDCLCSVRMTDSLVNRVDPTNINTGNCGIINTEINFASLVLQGWILEGLPDSRELARCLQVRGIIPRHVVVLYAPDIVLIERNLGKRVDEITGEVYHTTFDWPTDENIRWRLKAPRGISEKETAQRLLEYHRNFPGIVQSFGKSMKLINADQLCADAFWQVLSHVRQPPQTPAPFSPRILLCGPPGSGKISCAQMLKEAATSDTRLGKFIKPYLDGAWPVPDKIVIKLLSKRINRLDCYIRGWVLHGFPKDEDQAKRMPGAGIYPNR